MVWIYLKKRKQLNGFKVDKEDFVKRRPRGRLAKRWTDLIRHDMRSGYLS